MTNNMFKITLFVTSAGIFYHILINHALIFFYSLIQTHRFFFGLISLFISFRVF